MRPITRFFLYSFGIFFILFVALQPFNWFCQISRKCQKVYLLDLIPSFEGDTKINVVLEIKNFRKDLEFIVNDVDTITTVSGRKNTVNYKVKNNSNRVIKFKPKFYTEPKSLSKYINSRDCLCFEEYKLQKGEELDLQASFRIDADVEKDGDFTGLENNTIVVGYSVN